MNEKAPIPESITKWELCGHDILLKDCTVCLRNKVASLQAEVDALKKENFILDDVSTQQAERIAELKAEVARLSVPVTDTEYECMFIALRALNKPMRGMDVFNACILARATPPQDVENGGKQ